MRSKRAGLLLVMALVAGIMMAAFAAEPADETDTEEPLPERRVRPLPSDTFQPSEEISEDFPVPFPVDI